MISVVVPIYNQGEYVTDCLDSILSQTVRPKEIIVVNDGSTDNSGEIVDSYIPLGVKVIHQVNKGLPSARNTGIMNATGEYVFFIDSDDMLTDDCIEELTINILGTNADIVAPSFKCFGVSNQEVILMPNPTLEDFKTGNRVGHFCAVRRSKLLEIGGYNPKMIWGWEDYDLWIDLLKNGAIIRTIPKVLVLYRTKLHSMIHDANEHSTELTIQMRKNHPEVYE